MSSVSMHVDTSCTSNILHAKVISIPKVQYFSQLLLRVCTLSFSLFIMTMISAMYSD